MQPPARSAPRRTPSPPQPPWPRGQRRGVRRQSSRLAPQRLLPCLTGRALLPRCKANLHKPLFPPCCLLRSLAAKLSLPTFAALCFLDFVPFSVLPCLWRAAFLAGMSFSEHRHVSSFNFECKRRFMISLRQGFCPGPAVDNWLGATPLCPALAPAGARRSTTPRSPPSGSGSAQAQLEGRRVVDVR